MNKTPTLVYITAIAFFSFFSGKVCANNKFLENFIDTNTTLERGVYIIENNVKISEDATLTVTAGCQLLFKKGASIKVEGGLFLDGTANSLIEIKSEDINKEGLGLVVSGINSNAQIIISYSRFSYLLVPLNFEKNWSRKKVRIENNIFENIITGEPAIIIKNPDELSSSAEIPFSFSRNNFTRNNSNIYIESIESDVLNMKFEYNLITLNYYFGFEIGGGLNSPFSVTYDLSNMKYKAAFTGNSFFDNFLLHNKNDSIIQAINFGITGRSEKLDLNNNFFGNYSPDEIQKSFDHFNNNPSAPYILANKPLPSASDSAHGHIWKIIFNKDNLTGKKLPEIKEPALEILIHCNRPILVREGVQYVYYSYFDEKVNKIITKNLSCRLNLSKETKSMQFTIRDDVYVKNTRGFFTISGLKDNEGFEIPVVQVGYEELKKYFINNNINIKLDEKNNP